MTLQAQKAKPPLPAGVFTARMTCFMRLPARVADADMDVPIEAHTEVLAENTPDGVVIMWPYGEGTALATVTPSILQIPAGQ